MATPIQFRAAEAEATRILKADRAKLEWTKLPLASMPRDIQALASHAISAEIAAREAKAAFQSALDDKVDAPTGKRLIVTLGRDVSSSTDTVLVAWANASAGQTKTITFDQFIKG